jgi:hypothetical protein
VRAEGGIIHPSAMVRHEILRQVGGYRAEFEPAEDRDLWLRLAEVGQLANVPELVLKYRIHAQCVSMTHATAQYEKARQAIQEAHARRGLGSPERVEMWSLVDRRRNERHLRESLALSAARAGFYRPARKHAARVLLRRPWRSRAWKALLIALVGRAIAYRFGRARRAVLKWSWWNNHSQHRKPSEINVN